MDTIWRILSGSTGSTAFPSLRLFSMMVGTLWRTLSDYTASFSLRHVTMMVVRQPLWFTKMVARADSSLVYTACSSLLQFTMMVRQSPLSTKMVRADSSLVHTLL